MTRTPGSVGNGDTETPGPPDGADAAVIADIDSNDAPDSAISDTASDVRTENDSTPDAVEPDAPFDADADEQPDVDATPWTCMDVPEEFCGPPALARCVDIPVALSCVCDASLHRADILGDFEDFGDDYVGAHALVIHGRQAFPILNDFRGNVYNAGALVGEGRVYATDDHLGWDWDSSAARAGLTERAFAWVSSWNSDPRIGASNDWFAPTHPLEWLAALGYEVELATLSQLDEFDIWIMRNEPTAPEEVEVIEAWVRAGGGLVVWGNDQRMHEYEGVLAGIPGQRLLDFAGISVHRLERMWIDNETHLPAASGGSEHALCGIDALGRHYAGVEVIPDDQLAFARRNIMYGLDGFENVGPVFELAARFADFVGVIAPTDDEPLLHDDAPRFIAAEAQMRMALDLPTLELRAAESAKDYPSWEPNMRLDESVWIEIEATHYEVGSHIRFADSEEPQWQSTSRYAAPGVPVEIHVPEHAIDSGLTIRIGADGNQDWANEQLRLPRLSRTDPITSEVTSVANGFGGLIYILVPLGVELGPLEIEVRNSAEVPVWREGLTTVEAWQESLERAPAPWAELISEHVILTLPREFAETVDDPSEVLTFWRGLFAGAAELFGQELTTPSRASRVFFGRWRWTDDSRQYPFDGRLSETARALDPNELSESTWHLTAVAPRRYQWGSWRFNQATGLYILAELYLYEEVLGNEPARSRYWREDEREREIEHWREVDRIGEPRTAPRTEVYMQLLEEFGWSFYRDVFAGYVESELRELPDDYTRLQEWVVRSSVAAGRDLAPYYLVWNLDVSAATSAATAHLPEWEDHPMLDP